MNVQINQLVKSLLKKDTLEECSLQELEQFADRHPYFGAAQLLLTKKLQEEKSERYDEQLQKTFLFFNNPLWVQHLLNETGQAQVLGSNITETITPTYSNEETSPLRLTTTATSNPVTVDSKRNEQSQEQEPSETLAILADPIVQLEDTLKATETAQTETGIESSLQFSEKSTEEKKVIAIPSENTPEPLVKSELTFEPYHTIDYFASQGIQFKTEEKPSDTLGKQLKSFTDWLKSMKRLPVSEVIRNISPASETNVTQLALHSLDEKEVLTEAMAEVWEKQGNMEKAIEVYAKLSLLEPSKSLYFAAKIEELKKKK